MKATSSHQRKFSNQRRGARRWRIPPPLRGAAGWDGPEGLVVLQEIKGPLGTLLWTTLRSINAWVDSPPAERGVLFPERAADWQTVDILTAGPQRELESALQDLIELLRPGSRIDPEIVGQAATRVARWAEYNGYRSTSAAYFEAAANACLGNPGYSLAAGRSARDHARYPQAEAWFHRAIGVARQSGDWSTYADAYLGYGTMMLRRGNLPGARKHFQRAFRRAQRQSLHTIYAKAAHDLFVVEAECGHEKLAENYASTALRGYPEGHPSVLRLGYDVAYFWMERGALFPALRVFKAVLPLADAGAQPTILGGIAYASATLKRPDDFLHAKQQLEGIRPGPGVAEAWLEVARGARELAWFDLTAHAATIALRIADEREEHKIRFLAEQCLESCTESHEEEPIVAAPPLADERWDSSRRAFAEEIATSVQAGVG